DDDCNGLTDCKDPACAADPSCTVCGPVEICNNGIDDNCNGLVDCKDPGCATDPSCRVCGPVEICNNGIDDDCNGLTDCKDPACAKDPHCTTCGTVEICNNGVDDNCDGLIDCKDPQCATFPPCMACGPVEICGNGKDDDCNGLIDCADPECKGTPACTCGKVEICGNGKDDDCNGLTDCQDPACSSTPGCTCRLNREVCNDGVDNNCNGLIDCFDPECTTDQACLCRPGSAEICNNGRDDNCNGLVDCADPLCASDPACVTCITEICDNGKDDNCNQLIDCADPACSLASNCRDVAEVCDNFKDDNANGLVDCDDPACFFTTWCETRHENCNTALEVTASGTYFGDTSTFWNHDIGTCGGAAGEAVFRIVLTGPAHVTISQAGTPFPPLDGVTYLRHGSCSSGFQVGCDDDSGGNHAGLVDAPVLKAGVYYAFSDGFTYQDVGNYQYNITIDYGLRRSAATSSTTMTTGSRTARIPRARAWSRAKARRRRSVSARAPTASTTTRTGSSTAPIRTATRRGTTRPSAATASTTTATASSTSTRVTAPRRVPATDLAMCATGRRRSRARRRATRSLAPPSALPWRLERCVTTPRDSAFGPGVEQQLTQHSELPAGLRDDLVRVARSLRVPSLEEPSRLIPLVTELTRAYNDPKLTGVEARDHLAARLSFWLPRDLPKVVAAFREPLALGRLAPHADGAPLTVLDLGAGLGAGHRGLALALNARGRVDSLEVLAVDTDLKALRACEELARSRPSEGRVSMSVKTCTGDVHALPRDATRRRWDVVIASHVLTEMDLDLEPAKRVEAHRALLSGTIKERLNPDGLLVVVEPALKPRARHLQAVRDALLAGDAPPRLVSPCPHSGNCPLLARGGDWCHEDLPVDLPEWLVPIAKGAGLRWEGLTFFALTFARRGPTLSEALPPRSLRVVSSPLVTKGKHELLVCAGDLPGHGGKIGRLDRHATPENEPFARARRGDLLTLGGALDDKQRVGADLAVAAFNFLQAT
ncbi:MAG: MopE-related protein, partial [Polyangiales bacterium]